MSFGYNELTREFILPTFTDPTIASILDKHSIGGRLPELYWKSVSYAYQKSKDKALKKCLAEFKTSLATVGVPVADGLAKPKHIMANHPGFTPTGTELRDYQLEAAEALCRGSMVLGDSMGLGKTLSVLWAWNILDPWRLLVLTSSDEICDEWKQQISLHFGDYNPSRHIKDRSDLNRINGMEEILTIPYFRFWREGYFDAIKRWLKPGKRTSIVCDEAHRVSGISSRQHEALKELTEKFPNLPVWALSGTEVSNTPESYYGIYRLVTRSKLPAIAWKAHVQEVWSGKWKPERLKDIRILRRGFAMRRTQEEVGYTLPPLTEVTLKVPMHPIQADLYQTMAKEAQMEIKNLLAEKQVITESHYWTINLRLSQLCSHPLLTGETRVVETPKFSRLCELLDNLQEQKAIIWSNYPRTIDWIWNKLTIKFPQFKIDRAHGKIDKEVRAETKHSAQAGKVDILIANPAIWAEGVNLTFATINIYWDYTDSRVNWEQSQKRSHRTGQTKPVTIYRLVTRTSIEERKILWLTRKKELAAMITGN